MQQAIFNRKIKKLILCKNNYGIHAKQLILNITENMEIVRSMMDTVEHVSSNGEAFESKNGSVEGESKKDETAYLKVAGDQSTNEAQLDTGNVLLKMNYSFCIFVYL